MMRQLLNVVHQTKEMPLRIHLLLSAQRETIEPLVAAQVTEHRFHRRHALPVAFTPIDAINRLLHALGVGQRRGLLFVEERHLAGRGSIRVTQTTLAQVARPTTSLTPLKLVMRAAIRRAMTAARVKRLTCRTDTGLRDGVVVEVLGLKLGRRLGWALVVQRVWFDLVASLSC